MTLDQDMDALLIHRLFGPDAAVVRGGLDPDVCRRIDEAAMSMLGERPLEALVGLEEAEAEHLGCELAREIRAILASRLPALRSEAEDAVAPRDKLDRRITSLQAEHERLLRQTRREEA